MVSNIENYNKYKRLIRVMILEGEKDNKLEDVLPYLNSYTSPLESIDDMKKDTLENFLLHYRGGRRIAIKKDSLLGKILLSKVK